MYICVMLYITRKENFNSAHKLSNPNWSSEKNDSIFGKCANANWHGHNYDLWVTVRGIPNPDSGFIINTQHLSELVKMHVLEHLDHKNLNLDLDLGGLQPSTENLAIWIWNTLVPHIQEGELHCIKLQETENIYVEYYGK
jgi:6-pyruvoyltetrahydropterin/6-carboxytetrahydropterin synthase